MEDFEKKDISEPVLDVATRKKIDNSFSDQQEVQRPIDLSASSGGFWSKNKWFVLLLILGLAVVSVLAWFALRRPAISGQPKFNVSIEAPGEVNSGGEVVLKVVMENQDSKVINSPSVEVVFPSESSFVQAEPKPLNLSGTLYSFENISPGANVVLWLKVKLDGSVGDLKKFNIKVKYKLSGISADYETGADYEIALTSSGLSINWSGPDKASNGQPVEYVLRYSNQSEQDFESARILTTLPAGFQLAQTEPKANFGSTGWNIEDLGVGVSGELKLSGSFSVSSGNQPMLFKAELLVADGSGGYFKQVDSEYTTTIGSEPLVVSHELSSGGSGGVLYAGDTLVYRLRYQNLSSSAARGVSIVFSFDSNTVDLGSIKAEGAKVSGSEVTWSPGSTGSLSVLSPNDSGTLQLSVNVKEPVVTSNSKNPEVATSVKIISNEYDSYIKGNSLNLKVGAEVGLGTSLSYVSGANPPKVGVESNYRVTLSLTNTTSDVVDAELSASIPSGASFDVSSLNNDEAGRVSFDQSTGRIVWKVGTLRAFSGTFTPKRELNFNVSVIPSASEVGDPAAVLNNIKFSGLDNFTAKKVNLQADSILSSALGNNGRVTK